MACGGCAARRNRRANQKFQWTGPNGEKVTYSTEIEARARQIRSGGTYKPVQAG